MPGSHIRFRWHWLAAGVLGLLAVGILAFATLRPVKVLPRMQLAPGFALTDQEGQLLTNESLRGGVILYTFTYTRCPAPCQGLDETMRRVQDGLAGLDLGGLPVRLVSLSFDPEHDTPGVLATYAQAAGARSDLWRFATGDPARLKNIIGDAFSVYYAEDGAGGFQFDPALVLVDWTGIVRAKYDLRSSPPDADHILGHIALLAREAHNSSGPARLAYEAAHLFLCYEP